MTYHIHWSGQIRDFEERVLEIIGGGQPIDTFAGAGTTGIVPDPLTEQLRALSDTGEWRRASKMFFQPTEPTANESVAGDFWLVT